MLWADLIVMINLGVRGDENPESRRTRIFEFIRTHPGSHLREIKRELNLAMGVIQYHLYGLERDQEIISRRRGLHKRFYTTHVFGERQLDILDTLSQETERGILLFLIQNPNATQRSFRICEISPASTNWHMRRLSETGLVEAKHDRMNVRYFLEIIKLRYLRFLGVIILRSGRDGRIGWQT